MQYQRLVINSEQQQGKIINLYDEQAHYLRRVLRLSAGDRVIAITGKGAAWLVELTTDHGEIIAPIEIKTELPVSVTLLVSLPKQGIDEIVRCCTEIGVSTIVPVISERTVINPSVNKLTRWRRIAQEAAEQSERSIVPTLTSPMSFQDALTINGSGSSQRYFCVARYDVPLLGTMLSSQLSRENHVMIATGCEGGWTPLEVKQAQEAQFQLVSLGRRILRAVTAPISAMSLVAAFSENLYSKANWEPQRS